MKSNRGGMERSRLQPSVLIYNYEVKKFLRNCIILSTHKNVKSFLCEP
jgi:hypothetical protein